VQDEELVDVELDCLTIARVGHQDVFDNDVALAIMNGGRVHGGSSGGSRRIVGPRAAGERGRREEKRREASHGVISAAEEKLS
jgi:hypothetical protein